MANKDQSSVQKLRFLAILLMLLSSIIISFNGLVIRSIEFADNWTVIFYRALSFSIAVFLYLVFMYGKNVFRQIQQIGLSGYCAGSLLGASNICFIFSITTTTVANTVFTISLIPFMTAILAFFILHEKVLPITLYTMLVALFGVVIMFYGAFQIGEIRGNILALITAICFSSFTVFLRWNKTIDMLPCLLFSGLVAMVASFLLKTGPIYVSLHDLLLCFLLGGLMSGLVNCCFIFSARHLFSTEVTLFFFIEIALSPIWVWLFLQELISRNTLIGGSIILISLLIRSIYLIFIPDRSV